VIPESLCESRGARNDWEGCPKALGGFGGRCRRVYWGRGPWGRLGIIHLIRNEEAFSNGLRTLLLEKGSPLRGHGLGIASVFLEHRLCVGGVLAIEEVVVHLLLYPVSALAVGGSFGEPKSISIGPAVGVWVTPICAYGCTRGNVADGGNSE
jgi:hypothetical protein